MILLNGGDQCIILIYRHAECFHVISMDVSTFIILNESRWGSRYMIRLQK